MSNQTDGMPGYETDDLAALYPPFRARLEQLLAALRREGYPVRVRATYRSPERQRYYRAQGWSTIDRSYHTVTGSDGSPEALAADLVLDGRDWNAPIDHPDTVALAQFYRRLRALARQVGLLSGGEWSRRGKWQHYDLGWDPGHVQPAPWGGSIDSAHDRGRRPWTS